MWLLRLCWFVLMFPCSHTHSFHGPLHTTLTHNPTMKRSTKERPFPIVSPAIVLVVVDEPVLKYPLLLVNPTAPAHSTINNNADTARTVVECNTGDRAQSRGRHSICTQRTHTELISEWKHITIWESDSWYGAGLRWCSRAHISARSTSRCTQSNSNKAKRGNQHTIPDGKARNCAGCCRWTRVEIPAAARETNSTYKNHTQEHQTTKSNETTNTLTIV